MNELEKKILDKIADEWSMGNCKDWFDLKQWLHENSDNISNIFDELERIELAVRISLEETEKQSKGETRK